jgi:hypothetical protein
MGEVLCEVPMDSSIRFSVEPSPIFEILRCPERYDSTAAHAEQFKRALAEGEILFSAWVDATLAFCGWVQFNERRPGGSTRLVVPPHSAFIYRCFTRPEFRGRRIYPAAMAYLLAKLKADGIRQAYIDYAVSNIASAKGVRRVGGVPIGSYWVYQLGWRRFSVAEPDLAAAISSSAK